MKQILFLFVIVLLIAGNNIFLSCSVTQSFTAAETQYANTQWPGTTPDDLKTGMSLYQKNCGKCHYLYKPEKYSVGKWNQVLPGMAKTSNLSNTEEKMILRYLLTKRNLSEAGKGDVYK